MGERTKRRCRPFFPSPPSWFFFRSSLQSKFLTCFALADLLISLRALAPRSRASGSKEGAAAAAAAGVFSQSASEAAPVMPTAATPAAAAASIDETAEAAADEEQDALLASAALPPPAVRIRLAATSAAVRNISKKGGWGRRRLNESTPCNE